MEINKRHELAINTINKEIARLTRQRDRLKEKCFSNPAEELLKLRQEAKSKLDKHNTLEQRTSPVFINWMKEAVVKEKAIQLRMQEMTSGKFLKDLEKLNDIELAISDLEHSASILSVRG